MKQNKAKLNSNARRLSAFLLTATLVIFSGCQSNDILILNTNGTEEDADKLLIVDCLLPGQIKKLGAGATYVTPRRPAKLAALDCEDRGGEYVTYEQANSATALKVWLATAQEGNPEAQTYVGEIYEKGFGIRPDYKLAALWYEKAAKQGHARAKLNLGYLYEKGFGVEKNIKVALNMYRQASGLENTEIDFQSVIDTETAEKSVNEIRLMKSQIAKEEKRQQQQGNKLSTETNLLVAEQASVKAEADALAEQQARLEEQRKLAIESKQALRQREAQLKIKAQKLKAKERALKKKQTQIAMTPQTAVTTITAPLSVSRNRVDIAGPSIQLIRPKLVTMRGIPVINVRPENKTREIVGRVNAPGGIQAFSINGATESIDPRGLFRILYPISSVRNPVQISAIDRFGKNAMLEFELVQSEEKEIPQISVPDIDTDSVAGNFGRFHALVIGNNDYTQFPKLNTAINDAKSIAQVLSQQYGFKTSTLVNANRFTLLAALNRLSKRLKPNDNLLIYYAGHGELSKKGDVGYWLPVDADRNNKRKWISNTAISDILGNMPVKRVLVIADSCYAGALTRSSMAQQPEDVDPAERLTWLRAMAKSKARLAMTSGGLKPVADAGSSNHSLFANALLGALNQNQGVLEGMRLYSQLYGEVAISAKELNVDQVPEYAPIRHAGHESGEFFFLRRS